MFTVRSGFLWLSFSNVFYAGHALDAANWMKDNISWLGERQLKHLCVPGTHNSGMNRYNGGTAFSRECNTLNQSQGVRRQLELGARYLDIRPVISGGELLAGHYTKVGSFWQGGSGQSMASIVEDLNSFTEQHNELIMIRLSHTLNTDLGNRRYRSFVKREWDRLFRLLDDTRFRFKSSPHTMFTKMSLSELTKNGTKSAIIFTVQSAFTSVFLGKRVGEGYFYPSSLEPYNHFSNMGTYSTMFEDQVNKLESKETSTYFLLSWTLTQNAYDAATCPLGKTLRQLAESCNRNLRDIYPKVTRNDFPNIISVDFLENNDLAELVVDINKKVKY